MAPALSSNWIQLQKTLKQESLASADRKRKAIPTERQQNSLAKRRRLEESGKAPPPSKSKSVSTSTVSYSKPLGITRKKRKMGLGGSTESAPTTNAPAPSATLALWAEDNDISARDLADAYGGDLNDTTIKGKAADKANAGLSEDVEIGKYIGIDCEMVGVGEEDSSVLARVSIVNFHGTQVYDSFVKPKEFVTNWRTHVSGVSPRNMATAREFEDVQKEVADIFKDRVLIGHSIKNDLDALMLGHPKKDIRDTAKYPGFKKYSTGRSPSLKILAKEILGIEIQSGEHSSTEDARATMLLFRKHKSGFDTDNAQRFPMTTSGGGGKSKGGGKKKKSKR